METANNLYAQAGVSLETGRQTVDLIKDAVSSTHGVNVLAGVGAFGGLYSLTGQLEGSPVLVASTDGVGTKVKLAAALGRYDGIGQDIVNHCLNDIACAGAGVKPLFFLDYIASSKLEPEMVAQLVTGMATACSQVGCALLGGETAEMPGVYQPSEFDVVGTIVGLVNQNRLYPRPTMAAGDLLLGLPSSGVHTNGYSLIRSIFADTPLDTEFPEVGHLGNALLTPHRVYLSELNRLQDAGVAVQGLAHITGGGIVENLPRALPDGLTAHIDRSDWTVPPLFRLIQEKGGVNDDEMWHVFNMGIGMIVIIKPDDVEAALVAVGGQGRIVGRVLAADG